jgi:enterochelin esterase-like enzyme
MPLPGGRLEDHTIRSRALARPMRLHVYLPPRYGEFTMRYPVVYLLHPWGMDERYWTERLGLPKVADRLIHAGAVPPFIAVMPQGDKSFFVNAEDKGGDYSLIVRLDPEFFEGALEGYGDYGDYLLGDVIPFAERLYAARSDRAGRVIAGTSMGGAGGGVLAFTHPEVFGAVGIHSPTLFGAGRLGPPWIFGLGDEDAFARLDPIQLAGGLRPTDGLRIYLDCGQEDDLCGLVDDLHYALAGGGIEHVYYVRPGGHNGDYWRAHLAEYIGFYAAGW